MSPITAILLADLNRGASLSESFRSHAGMGREDVLLGLLMAAALVAGLWAASRLLGLRRRRGYHNPRQLFRALCNAHHLTWSDRALLTRLARHHGLRDPGRLFLELQRWDEQVLGVAFALDFVHLRTLRKQIFEGASQGVPDAAPRAVANVRGAGLGRSLQTLLSDGGARGESSDVRGAGSSRKAHAQSPEGGITGTVASPLFPALPTPTLDVPPWTEARVEP